MFMLVSWFGLTLPLLNAADWFRFFFSSRRRHTSSKRDWSSDVCSSDLGRRYADVSPLAGGRRRVIRVVVDDLAFLAATAVVRPSTTRLDPTTPALRRLETVGGTAFSRHLQLQKELPVGAAVVTAGGGDLPADFVIHAVIRSDTEPVTRDGVARAWRSALQQVQEWEFGTVTVPPIGTGAGNLTAEAALRVPPGAAYYRLAVAERQVGFASSTIDTSGTSVRVTDVLVLQVPAVGTLHHTTAMSRATLSRTLRFEGVEAKFAGELGRFAARGLVSGDTVLSVSLESATDSETTR